MPEIEIPVRMTVAMIFFGIAGLAGYHAIERPELLWIVRSSLLFFAALGPLPWSRRAILRLPASKNESVGSTELGGLIRWAFGLFQIILLCIGGYYAWTGVAMAESTA